MVALVVAALLAIATGSTVPGNFKAQGRAEYPNNDPKRKYEGPVGEQCEPNEYDGDQHCQCSEGQMLTHFKSTFASGVNDRRWELECGDDDGIPWTKVESSDWPHDWQANLDWDGRSSNKFMVGLQSYHDNGHEDRRYNILFARLDDYVYAKDCKTTIIKSYQKSIDITLGDNEAIARLRSHHHDDYEDRNWAITVCKLIPKCGVFGSTTWADDWTEDDVDITTQSATTYNELIKIDGQSNAASQFTVSNSESDTSELASQYTLSTTKGSSTTLSGSFTVGAKFFGVGMEATAGFERTFSSEISFGSTQSKSYSESSSSEMSHTAWCEAGCHCKMTSWAKKYNGTRDFTTYMVTEEETYNDEDNECTIHGTLEAKNAGDMHFPVLKACKVRYAVLSSYERAAEKRGTWLGQFELQWDGDSLRKHNDRVVYKQTDLYGSARWLYYSSDDYWVVGFEVNGVFPNSDKGYLRAVDDHKKFHPPTSGWEYKHDGDFHSDDPTLTLQYQDEPVTPCSEVIVAAEGDTLKRQYWSWGTYRPTGLMSEGRPVYKRETVEDWGDRFLMVSGSGSSGRWSIRTAKDSKYSRVLSGRATPSPADPEAAARPDSGYTKWRLIHNNAGGSNKWVEGELTFTCVPCVNRRC